MTQKILNLLLFLLSFSAAASAQLVGLRTGFRKTSNARSLKNSLFLPIIIRKAPRVWNGISRLAA